MTRDLRAAMRVYAITPDSFERPEHYAAAVGVAVSAGVTAVQFRDKRERDADLVRACAQTCADVCRSRCVLFVVNDDPDLALAVGADGVHLGPHDARVAEVRTAVGQRLLIGGSAGGPEQALALVSAGADYLGVGAIFDAHASKPNASAPRGIEVLSSIRAVPELANTPIVAIGGITAERAAECMAAGADGVAAIRGILGARNVSAAVAAYLAGTA